MSTEKHEFFSPESAEKYLDDIGLTFTFNDSGLSPCSAGLDCPNCNNEGGYGVPYMDTSGVMQAEERQCQWCHETPNSKFNLSQNSQDQSPI